MSKPGRTLIAWPEDRVVAGDELAALMEKLGPKGTEVTRLLGGTALGDEVAQANRAEAARQCEAAVLEVVDHFEEPLTMAGAQDLIVECWDRADEATIDSSVYSGRRHLLAAAVWGLMEKEVLQPRDSEFLLIRAAA